MLKWKFQIGDRVQNVSQNSSNYGKIGKIHTRTAGKKNPYRVMYEDGVLGDYGSKESFTKEINNNETQTNTMDALKTLGTMITKMVDADTAALLRSGILNGDLELTEKGRRELRTIEFFANKAALVARAKEVIAEAEAACKK